MPADPNRVQAVFLAAAGESNPVDRAALLARECGDETELRQRVDDLLQAHDQPQSFLERPAAAFLPTVTERPVTEAQAHDQPQSFLERPAAAFLPTVTERPVTEAPGSAIGPYKLLEQIGEGGFGVVFMAEQTQPVRRKVALKVLKPGMDTKQVVARFEAERQALAIMDHPHIARVFDGGATPSGRPFFVMELVKGVPITEYCDQNHLTPKQRLELFVAVCQAVQHAHQKGIIHRDLKPSNVLVAVHDTTPVVKVIDFGVAKALGQELTEKTVFTGFAQMIGTPLYMSPEQAGQSSLDVDTRSDIYSLGVMLYELLTGTTPFDRARLKDASYEEIRRIIREEEPARPSHRISTLEARAGSTICERRQSDPRRLSSLFRGELDWIVMKALEKDRNRRYETANGLVLDIQRYLADEPVQACPPSAWYRFRKLLRRNKARFVTATVVATTLLVASAIVAWKWFDADTARLTLAEERGQQATERAERARERADEAKERADQLQRDLDRLNAVNRLVESARLAADSGRWHEAETQLTEATKRWPNNSYTLSQRGEFYLRLGLWDLAAADFARVLELGPPESPQSWSWHALLRLYVGDTEGWRTLAIQLPQHFKQTRGDRVYGWSALARTLALAPAPDIDLDWAVEQAELAVKIDRGPWTHNALGLVHYRAGRYEQALGPLQVALRLDRHWWYAMTSQSILAMALHRLGRANEARQALTEAARNVDQWEQHQLGVVPGALGVIWWDVLEGVVLYREAKILLDGSPPPDDPRPLVMRGRALAALKREREAAEFFDKAVKLAPHDLQIRMALLPRDQTKQGLAEAVAGLKELLHEHPEQTAEAKRALAQKYCDLAWQLRSDQRYEDAVEAYSQAIEVVRDYTSAWYERGFVRLANLKQYNLALADYSRVIELDPKNVNAWINRGQAHDGLHQNDDAIADSSKATELDPKNAIAHNTLGVALYAKGRTDEAIAEYQKAIELDPKDAAPHGNLGNALQCQGKLDAAIAEYHKAIKLDPKLAIAHFSVGNLLQAKGRTDEAIAEFHKAIELDPKLADPHVGLGNVLRKQEKLDEAFAEFQKALELEEGRKSVNFNPRLALFHLLLGGALQSQAKLDEAVAEYRKAIELDPLFAPAHEMLGNALTDQGKLDEALAQLHKAIKLDPNFAEAHSILGFALIEMEKLDEAVAECRKAIELDATDPQAHYHLSLALRKQGKLDEGAAECRSAIELDPELRTANYWRSLGAARYRAGKWKEATAALERSVELRQGGDAFDWLVLAMAEWQRGNKDDARRWYEKAAAWRAQHAPDDRELQRFEGEAKALLEEERR
jgi:tetratricopeptide (TPR) repeat protein